MNRAFDELRDLSQTQEDGVIVDYLHLAYQQLRELQAIGGEGLRATPAKRKQLRKLKRSCSLFSSVEGQDLCEEIAEELIRESR